MNHLQERVRKFVSDRPVMEGSNSSPEYMAQRLIGEALEATDALGTPELGEELVDVIFMCLSIANQAGIDIDQEFETKLAFNEARYPAHEFQSGDYQMIYNKLKERGKLLKPQFYGDHS